MSLTGWWWGGVRVLGWRRRRRVVPQFRSRTPASVAKITRLFFFLSLLFGKSPPPSPEFDGRKFPVETSENVCTASCVLSQNKGNTSKIYDKVQSREFRNVAFIFATNHDEDAGRGTDIFPISQRETCDCQVQSAGVSTERCESLSAVILITSNNDDYSPGKGIHVP